MQFYLVAFIVGIGLRLVHPNDEVDKNPDGVHKNFVHLFDSIQNNRETKTLTYRSALEQEAAREKDAFDTMKEDLRLTRQRNNFHRKRRDSNGRVAQFKREIVRGDEPRYDEQYPNAETDGREGDNTAQDWLGKDGMVDYKSEDVTPDDTVSAGKCETNPEATESSSASTSTIDEDSIIVAKSSLTQVSTCATPAPTSAYDVGSGETQTNGAGAVCTKRIRVKHWFWWEKVTIPVQQSFFAKYTCEIMYCTPGLEMQSFPCKDLYALVVPADGNEDFVNGGKLECASEKKCAPP